MEARRDLGMLPIPEHRRRRIPMLAVIGAIVLVVGWITDIGFVWGLGAGMLIVTGIALLADRWARGRARG